MTSNINPNNIDGAYPVAGQDNNSQGFRDNFTNTKTNFQFAANEITALQNSVVLTSNLSNSAPVVNNLLTSTLSNGYLQNMYEPTVVLGSLSGSVPLNYALGSYQTVTTNGPISLDFSNWPSAGKASSLRVQINVTSTAHTVTIPVAVSVNNTGIQGLDASTNIITFAAIGIYTFAFSTSNGGTIVTVNETNKEIQPFNNSSEDLAPSTGANLSVTTSYFSTAAAETATLAAGTQGQIKVFAAASIGAGNMVITVTNAGWKASGTGTLTFDTLGDACTLQYVNSKWFCIGNNGCVFG